MPRINRRAIHAVIRGALSEAGHGAGSELARACDVTPQTVSKWKAGSTHPEPVHWEAIERTLDLPPGELRRAAQSPPSTTGEVERAIDDDPFLSAEAKAVLAKTYRGLVGSGD